MTRAPAARASQRARTIAAHLPKAMRENQGAPRLRRLLRAVSQEGQAFGRAGQCARSAGGRKARPVRLRTVFRRFSALGFDALS